MIWLKDDLHKKRGPRKVHKYTKEKIEGIVKHHNCTTYTDLRRVNDYAYKIAKVNNWLKELGLIEKKHEDGYWTEDRVWLVARQYTNKNDFSKHESVAYKWASYYGLLEKMDWMRSPTYDERRENHDSEVYAFIDKENRVVYVGLSIDSNVRKKNHKYDKKSAVKKYRWKQTPIFLILKKNLTIDESAYWEDYYKEKYRNEGYKVLNVARTGLGSSSIGGISKWSSREDVFKESHNYRSRSEFKKQAGGAYHHALSNGWLDEMHWLQRPKREIKWTYERVVEESRKYQYKGDFHKGSPSAYQVASEKGWLKAMTWFKEKRKPNNFWTKERVFKESRKYSNKKEFEKNAKTAYWWATREGWLKQMTWLKPLPLGPISIWTREKIIEESKKYTSRKEFAVNSPTAYQHAIEDKSIFHEMPWLAEKIKPNGWWNDKARVMEEGKKYKTRTEFAQGSYTAWKKAKQNGWIEEMTWFNKHSH
ncbi:MAG: GIY-YIG nuclease family protein [Bacteroidaceae bacterium]|nr:GIY-YIG nuclease family protein [Bacteroidaceae bacterium]